MTREGSADHSSHSTDLPSSRKRKREEKRDDESIESEDGGKRECPICCEEHLESSFYGCQMCETIACVNCQKSFLVGQAKTGRHIRSTCLKKECGFYNPHTIAPFQDVIKAARPKPRLPSTKPADIKQLIEYLHNYAKTPCCSEDYTTDDCMTIECRCGAFYCGFCGQFEYEIFWQDSIEDHTPQCRRNDNPVQYDTVWHSFKSPYPHGRDFDYHQLREKIKFVNHWLNDYSTSNGVSNLNASLFDNRQLLDAVAGVHIKDREKTILYFKSGNVCVRYVHGLSKLFSVFETLFIKELPTPADERENRMNRVKEHVRDLWERLGNKVLLDRRYNFELFNGFTDQLLALSEERMVHVLTIALSVVEESDEPTILFSTRPGGQIRL